MNDPASDGCAAHQAAPVTPTSVGGQDSSAQVNLAYAVRIYPTAIKAWALGALCDLYKRQFNEQLDWCAQQKNLASKA